MTADYLDGVFRNLELAVEHELADPMSLLQTDPAYEAVRSHDSFAERVDRFQAAIAD